MPEHPDTTKATSNIPGSPITTTMTTRNWRDSFGVYWHPRILSMALLGFTAGIPYLLVFSTLTAWLTEAGVTRASIGFFTWIGVTYSIKVIWSPVVDRLRLPLLTTMLGQRRSWMLFAQGMIVSGLIGMALTNPATQLLQTAAFALLVAFGAATQDIAIDAWRIESVGVERQAAMSAVYVFCYRIAMIVSGAGALKLATWLSWTQVYCVMAALIGIGTITVLCSAEPERRTLREGVLMEQRVQDFLLRNQHLPEKIRNIIAWMIGAVICPFVDFSVRYGRMTFVLLVVVGGFRICDVCMASMAIPFYIDIGFTKGQIAAISGVWGVIMAITGAMIGGVLVPRIGLLRLMLAGVILFPLANLLFALLATVHHPALWMLTVPISVENLCGGFGMAVLIAWMSSLTSANYTATQYAVFSSLMTLPAKFIGGFSGLVVEAHGYPFFFVYVSSLGIPAIIAVVYLLKRDAAAKLQSVQ